MILKINNNIYNELFTHQKLVGQLTYSRENNTDKEEYDGGVHTEEAWIVWFDKFGGVFLSDVGALSGMVGEQVRRVFG